MADLDEVRVEAMQVVTYRDDNGDVRFVRMEQAKRDEIVRGLKLQEERLHAVKERIAELIVMMEYFVGHPHDATLGEVQKARRG
jgi:hypothetical protein